MKIKRDLFFVLVVVGLQIPISGIAGSFSTSFDIYNVESNGVSILSCPSPAWSPGQLCDQVFVMRWDLGQIWPDNGLQRKLKLDLSNRQSSGVKTSKDIPLTGHQKASVQFYAPNGISDHIDLGVLGDNISAVQLLDISPWSDVTTIDLVQDIGLLSKKPLLQPIGYFQGPIRTGEFPLRLTPRECTNWLLWLHLIPQPYT